MNRLRAISVDGEGCKTRSALKVGANALYLDLANAKGLGETEHLFSGHKD